MYSAWDTAEAVGFPIRKFTDQSLLAAPRDLSQRATSFIASQCQGIHQMPFRRLISTPTKTLAPRAGTSLLANQPTGLVVSAVRCYSQPARLVSLPAEERPRSLALHLHLSMIPSLAGHNDERKALVIVHVAVLWFLPTVLEAERLASTIDTNLPLGNWWRQTGSNRRPPACKAGALPTELCPRLSFGRRDLASSAPLTFRCAPASPASEG
jgi:hypothetical protein